MDFNHLIATMSKLKSFVSISSSTFKKGWGGPHLLQISRLSKHLTEIPHYSIFLSLIFHIPWVTECYSNTSCSSPQSQLQPSSSSSPEKAIKTIALSPYLASLLPISPQLPIHFSYFLQSIISEMQIWSYFFMTPSITPPLLTDKSLDSVWLWHPSSSGLCPLPHFNLALVPSSHLSIAVPQIIIRLLKNMDKASKILLWPGVYCLPSSNFYSTKSAHSFKNPLNIFPSTNHFWVSSHEFSVISCIFPLYLHPS